MSASDALARLLAVDGSKTAQALRWGLHGLCAALRQAAAETPDDPGRDACADLLTELDALLRGGAQPSPEAPRSDALLGLLRQAVLDDAALRRTLGELTLSADDATLWGEVQRLLLRVRSTLADPWREQAATAARLAGTVPTDRTADAVTLPWPEDEVVYPGLVGPVQAPSLCGSRLAPLDDRLGPASGDGDLGLLARLVSACLRLLEIEPQLHHALRSVCQFDVCRLHDDQRRHFVAELLSRFARVRAETAPVAALRARLDLDEVIHSLVFLPPAERDSWWGRLQQTARQTLTAAADAARTTGCRVQLVTLSGLYADVCRMTEKDLELRQGGVPGEVLACLRVYARIGDDVFKGRVLYRSLGAGP